MTRTSAATSAALLAAVLLFLPSAPVPARADGAGTSVNVSDSPTDGQQGARLDVTRMRVVNGADAVDAVVRVRRVSDGELALYLRAVGRGNSGLVRILVHHVPGDEGLGVATIRGERACPDATFEWGARPGVIALRVPSSCVLDGDYGRLRARLITEIGSDADTVLDGPGGGWAWSAAMQRRDG